ncbi:MULTISPECIES: DNA phosphorothioation-associated putative methyltransferase [unclassified Coleofasciculus]|uniref:DNA phosphorothioation-associated putative methyltransferase n=1 Tax=unclassified Coleofasciculus TaxID=2692782 RepID=UPI0018810967|nr:MULTISPECIES: DNA phosphorothioation-associated putative methyltransferase [unclassified Coleofasciculus]MBE9125351.1 DNA phosphorothioation-associated putative methyltransferase [Coleofasciculus sp. LEGE 07081]MBE9148554.1 DNA phosphorothioation-associated putative methyltransferase [Coleofasciculus sp. LEGE 07092]
MVAPVPEAPEIERHRAAIVRTDLSKPVRLAIESATLTKDTTFFDYGCGHGGDIQRLGKQGYSSTGWDPHYQPDNSRIPADVVNLGYVINVIEDQAERREALLKAWELTQNVLIVAAQVLIDDRASGQIAYGDGIVTRRNTFQKYYEQEELKAYIDQVLSVDAIPVDLGIYFVFRDETQAESFRASRFRSRTTTPRIRLSIKRFEDYQELLAPLITFVTERGRLPSKTELPNTPEILEEFGTLRRAFQVILQATNQEEWDAIAEKRCQDLLVYLALTKFSHRPKFSYLGETVRNDIKALFGGYQQACAAADLMLLSVGDTRVIAHCCQHSSIGKRLPNALYVHISAIEALNPQLRLYEGCASRTIGHMEGATLVKFHTKQPKISYLFYPAFDTEPHPALHTSMQIDLRDLQVTYRDYDTAENPPILHRKETFVTPDYPFYEKFAKLTRQEENWGLLDNTRTIGTRKGWQQCLLEHCAELQGHRVIWRKDADPYRIKLLQSARRQRRH